MWLAVSILPSSVVLVCSTALGVVCTVYCTGLLLMYHTSVGAGSEPVTEQFSPTGSPGEREAGPGEMWGPEGIAEKKLFNQA